MMKKKGLIITLISTVIVVAIVGGMSLGTLFKKDDDPSVGPGSHVSYKLKNEGNNKGSAADPYYIYDTETFTTLLSKYGADTKPVRELVKDPVMIDVVDENGVPQQVQKKDENGELVYETRKDENGYDVYKDVEGTEPYHFQIVDNIDFDGVDFKGLFNKNSSFIGRIDGNGKTVKNITMSVTVENIADYISLNNNQPYIHIGVFGDLNGAKITNANFDAISVVVDNEVYKYLQSAEFWTEYKKAIYEISIGSIAACAVNGSVIEANVNATINADAYGVYMEDQNQGRNGVGGIVGYVMNSTISNANNGSSNITIIADNTTTKNYYIGGVSGYMFNSVYSNLDVSTKVTASAVVLNPQATNKLYIGGVTGYMLGSTVKDSLVNLVVEQLADEVRIQGSGVSSINNGAYNMVAGVASIVRANNADQASKITNVRINSDVDMDCLFGGAVFEVKSTHLEVEYKAALEANDTYEIMQQMQQYVFVELTDLTVTSKVNTLMAYGVGFKLLYTKINYTADYKHAVAESAIGQDKSYNVLLSGNTILSTNNNMITAGVISTDAAAAYVHCSLNQIRAMASLNIFNQFGANDAMKVQSNLFGNFSYVD